MISSRKEKNVTSAIDKLRKAGLQDVIGLVCHVKKAEDRSRLIAEVLTTIVYSDLFINTFWTNMYNCEILRHLGLLFILQTVKSYGGIDILVSNAAVNPWFGSAIDVRTFSINEPPLS